MKKRFIEKIVDFFCGIADNLFACMALLFVIGAASTYLVLTISAAIINAFFILFTKAYDS